MKFDDRLIQQYIESNERLRLAEIAASTEATKLVVACINGSVDKLAATISGSKVPPLDRVEVGDGFSPQRKDAHGKGTGNGVS